MALTRVPLSMRIFTINRHTSMQRRCAVVAGSRRRRFHVTSFEQAPKPPTTVRTNCRCHSWSMNAAPWSRRERLKTGGRAMEAATSATAMAAINRNSHGRSNRVGHALSTIVKIGNVERVIENPNVSTSSSSSIAHNIPQGYLEALQDDTVAVSHLQWMLQKEALGQDVLLIGTADTSVLRRRLVYAFCQLTQQAVQVLTVSHHTTESDLKQRRVLISSNDSSSSSATTATHLAFVDQAPVRAARHGHVLFLDGLHRAERNVLAVLNNLLENREMPLENGTTLVSAQRHQQLLQIQEHTSGLGPDSAMTVPSSALDTLIPVAPTFRVVASLTVPKSVGGGSSSSGSSSSSSSTLDPPVRSRFQIRRIDAPSTQALYSQLLLHQESDMEEEQQQHQALARQLSILATNVKGGWFTASTALPALVKSHRLQQGRHALMGDDKANVALSLSLSSLERAVPYVSTEPRLQAALSTWPAAVAAADAVRRAHQDIVATSRDSATSATTSSLLTLELESIQAVQGDGRQVQARFATRQPASSSPTSDAGWLGFQTTPKSNVESTTVALTIPSGGIPLVRMTSTLNMSGTKSQTAQPVGNDGSTVGAAAADAAAASFSLVWTTGLQNVLSAMVQEHAVGRDILLVSPPGEGKNAMARYFCDVVGYRMHLFPLYKEMTATDLLFRRSSTNRNSSTTAKGLSAANNEEHESTARDWEESPLLQAARTGQVCVLDGIEKLSPDTLATLQGFLCDREVYLPDGTKYAMVRPTVDNGTTSSNMTHDIHPSFRVIALASIANTGMRSAPPTWLSEEVISMFSTIPLPAPTRSCLGSILRPQNAIWAKATVEATAASPKDDLTKLLDFHEQFLVAAESAGLPPLSIRTLSRLARNVDDSRNSLSDNLRSCLMVRLMTPTQQSVVDSILKSSGVDDERRSQSSREQSIVAATSLDVHVDDQTLRIGDFAMARRVSHNKELVPAPFFFDIPSHVAMIQTLLREWKAGERSFLLLGNQGTGKNKICDRLCELANFEREYMQLHRDSTIGQLTISPSLEGGKIVWKDSPLVRAVLEGRVLVIDEADKAPPEVVAVLKSLVEDGELLLADGRRILRNAADASDTGAIIAMHPDFTVLVLANRPGKLFHGNRFEIMDCFSSHVVPNPDMESELKLLQAYAPNVEESLLRRLTASFDELRMLFESGDVTYPYSTREAVSVAKHLQKFSDDDIVAVLHNVLDMDSYNEHVYDTLGEVFRRHGFPFEKYELWARSVQLSRENSGLNIQYKTKLGSEGQSTTPPPLSAPKLGKWDEKNEAHVGGNQWQGGTGGSDTAGLGGRGGPYRLDRGHKVHQVSDEAKAEVSEEARLAARRIAEKALADRLKEIGMNEAEHEIYEEFIEPIYGDVDNLKVALEAVSYRSSERDWIKRQLDGDLDDSRLIEGIAGERNVYKRRGIVEPSVMDHSRLNRAKRLRFVVDCSGSMYRFNGYDQRLTRCLQAAALVMLCFDGLGEKFDYSIVGHSGDTKCIELVPFGQPPANEKERLQVLRTMVAHAQFCESGDNTLGAIRQALSDVAMPSRMVDTSNDTTDSVVIAISDANLERYGIHPRELNRAMHTNHDASIKAFCIFIASFGDEAELIRRELPAGRAFVCKHSSDLPSIVRNILTVEIA